MKWIKKGHIYNPDGKHYWNKSHAQVPVPLVLEDKIRVYYSSRDVNSISRISFIDLDLNNPSRILYIHDQCILEPGRKGTFDDCGVIPSWVTKNNNQLYMYYIGWNVRNTIPYYNSVGLAVSKDNGFTFNKISEGPLWDRNILEPYFSATTCVIKHNELWHCYYLSCTEFRQVNSVMEPRYHIKYASSIDGIEWKREGKVAIDYIDDNEAGIVKASVIVKNSEFKMWYSYRKFENYRTNKLNSYKIGYAESTDGINWIRKDHEAGIVSDERGWESNMMAYPHVINLRGNLVMFYNGNGFGESGFGYAIKSISYE